MITACPLFAPTHRTGVRPPRHLHIRAFGQACDLWQPPIHLPIDMGITQIAIDGIAKPSLRCMAHTKKQSDAFSSQPCHSLRLSFFYLSRRSALASSMLNSVECFGLSFSPAILIWIVFSRFSSRHLIFTSISRLALDSCNPYNRAVAWLEIISCP